MENLAPQGYWPENLGLTKVTATAALCQRLHPPLQVHAVPERFRRFGNRDLPGGPSVAAFFCVDRIATRRRLWEALGNRVGLVVDGRLSAEVIRVLAVADSAATRHYPTTLFDSAEAYVGTCTARSTIYTASIAAGLMIAQLARWLRRLPVDPDLTLNLLAAELTAVAPESRSSHSSVPFLVPWQQVYC